jgi:hypothetical protein
MQLIPKFVTLRAIASSADPDTGSADRAALAACFLNMNLLQSAIVARALAQRQAQGSGSPVSERGIGKRRHRHRENTAARVRVPNVRELTDLGAIEKHLQDHKLRAEIHREVVPEIHAPRVLRQWPAPDSEVLEQSQIRVVLLVPEDGKHAGSEKRVVNR